MPFTPPDRVPFGWQNNPPSTATPLSAENLETAENNLATYVQSVIENYDAYATGLFATQVADAATMAISAWQPLTSYSATEQVVYGNQLYSAVADHTSDATFDPAKWTLVGASSFLPGSGDGSDGAVLLDGVATVTWAALAGSTYTLNRDIYPTDLTIDSGITLVYNGFRVLCQETWTNNGTVGIGGNNASGATAGAATNSGSIAGGQPGGNGATGAGAAGSKGSVGSSGAGGAGGTGAAGAASTAVLPDAASAKNALAAPYAALSATLTYGGTTVRALTGGCGGGGGGGDGTNAGGGGGSGGPPIVTVARNFINNGTINAKGGNGAAGVAGNAGGGGGGGGGLVLVYTLTAPTPGTVNVSGGTGGASVGTGTAGATGSVGQSLMMTLNTPVSGAPGPLSPPVIS